MLLPGINFGRSPLQNTGKEHKFRLKGKMFAMAEGAATSLAPVCVSISHPLINP